MQRLRKCLGIDIGATSVKIAEISSERNGVRVNKLAIAEIGMPPGPMDSERINALAKTVRELLSRNKIGTKQAVFCLPGQSVFIRRIKVPRTTDERLHRIVAYEARQQIPFALDNSLMEYQVFDYGEGSEIEVLLVAIKKDIVTDYMKVFNKTGLKPVMVSVTSLAVFNFHVFDSTAFDELSESLAPQKKRGGKTKKGSTPEGAGGGKDSPKKGGFLGFGKKKSVADSASALEESADLGPEITDEMPEDVYEEVRAYVSIGAQTFDLTIARLGRHKSLGFTRSVPWAGNELTRSLQEKLGLESLDAAEEMKRQHSLVVVPGREEEAQESGVNADASEFTTAWADKLILDLRKSFDFYISQPDGLAVDAIVLSGGQSITRNLAIHIEDKLGIPVEVKTQPSNTAMVMAEEPPDPPGIAPFIVSIGLALTGIGLGQITVDFLPTELKTIREFKKKNIEVFLLMGAIAGMIVVSTQIGQTETQNMQKWIDDNSSKLASIQQTKLKLENAKKGREDLNARFTTIGQAISDRSYWLEFMGIVESVKPADVLITSLSMHPDGIVEINCETEVVGSISAFAEALKTKKQWVRNVDITSPAPKISFFIQKEVWAFTIRAEAVAKDTRLAPARVTLAPGVMTPTPIPAGGIVPGMPGGAMYPPGVRGGPGMPAVI